MHIICYRDFEIRKLNNKIQDGRINFTSYERFDLGESTEPSKHMFI